MFCIVVEGLRKVIEESMVGLYNNLQEFLDQFSAHGSSGEFVIALEDVL